MSSVPFIHYFFHSRFTETRCPYLEFHTLLSHGQPVPRACANRIPSIWIRHCLLRTGVASVSAVADVYGILRPVWMDGNSRTESLTSFMLLTACRSPDVSQCGLRLMEDNVGVSSSCVLHMEVCTFALVLVPYTRYSLSRSFLNSKCR